MPALEENGVVRNGPPPGVEPSSLKRRPYGVSAGKSVWQVPQGWPVWRAKLSKAFAGDVVPIVRSAAKPMSASAANKSPQVMIRLNPSLCIAAFPSYGALEANTHRAPPGRTIGRENEARASGPAQ